MADFNLEDKITFDELAPSLQKLLNGLAPSTDYASLQKLANKLDGQLNGIRLTITANQSSVSSPLANKEISVNTTNDIIYTFSSSGKWVPTGAVYS
jgi:hypothetical protein